MNLIVFAPSQGNFLPIIETPSSPDIVADKKEKRWQKEIQKMLSNGFKLEVEALISKDISYVTQEYVPERLAKGDFLD